MAIKPIGLSFKNNEEDMELYKWITAHSNVSGFIKDTLRSAKGNDTFQKASSHCGDKKTELIDMNF